MALVIALVVALGISLATVVALSGDQASAQSIALSVGQALA
jgi:hypothetical protein